MNIFLLGNQDTVDLFTLLVINGLVVNDPDIAKEKIKELKKTRKADIILLSESLVEKSHGQLNRLEEQRKLPIIIDIPDDITKGEETESELKQALGLQF